MSGTYRTRVQLPPAPMSRYFKKYGISRSELAEKLGINSTQLNTWVNEGTIEELPEEGPITEEWFTEARKAIAKRRATAKQRVSDNIKRRNDAKHIS